MADIIILGVIFVLLNQLYVTFISPYVPSFLELILKGTIVGLLITMLDHLFTGMKFPEGESFLYAIGISFIIATSYDKFIKPVVDLAFNAIKYFIIGVVLYKTGQWLYHNWKEAIVWFISIIISIVALFFVFSPV